jgi:hypothetical protein
MLRRTVIPVLLVVGAVASAQVSVEEAQRRLREKLATRPSATQPLSDVDRLRVENGRLRQQNNDLQREVDQLRTALAAASGAATTSPTTVPAQNVTGPGANLIGRWQGGNLRDGNAFITEFADDGTYTQSWLTSSLHESGHWTMPSDDSVEMWTAAAEALNQKHNRWRVTFGKDQLTLMPLASDDTVLPGAKALVLQHAH